MEPTLAASTYIASAIALFTITNPIGSLPIFLGATSAQPPAQQRRMAWLVALAVFVVLAIALIIGTYILQAFGIDIIAFKIAGNLLVAVIGWAMLTAKQNPAHAAEGQSPVVVPLAIPVIAGPGAIALVISDAHSYTSIGDYGIGIVMILVVAAIIGAVLATGPTVARILKPTGMSILMRVFGLLLLSIAVQSIISAIGAVFPVLLGESGVISPLVTSTPSPSPTP